MRTRFLTFVFALIVAILPFTALATPPAEITDHFIGDGKVLMIQQRLTDSELKHVALVQYGSLYAIVFVTYKNDTWHFGPDDILEVFIAIDKKPHVVWSRPPTPALPPSE